MSGAHKHSMSGTNTNTHTHSTTHLLISSTEYSGRSRSSLAAAPCIKKDEEKKNFKKIKNLETVDMIKTKTTADIESGWHGSLLFGCANAEHDFEMVCHVFSYQLTCLYGVFSNTDDKNSMFSISIPSMKKSS